jgi:hypothetical protein
VEIVTSINLLNLKIKSFLKMFFLLHAICSPLTTCKDEENSSGEVSGRREIQPHYPETQLGPDQLEVRLASEVKKEFVGKER